MESLRFNAINHLSGLGKEILVEGGCKITSIFGENVFTLKTAREYLSDEAYKSLVASIKTGKKIDRTMGNHISAGLRHWAEAKGVTHFTHWFQPLTGTTAEKHDSFFTLKGDGTPIEEFDGAALIQQEPDASSFPSGGLRATFEARGYTAWDPTSPVFIMNIGDANTLCIPTIFVSYTGESLDTKTPLLRSLEALNRAAVDVCNYFDKNITKVTATLGWEQEYFVVDAGLANARPDLVMTGRTVFGHSPAKGQQLEDHYFGSIPERIYAFMKDFEEEAYRLGIPLRTRHNEVAPAQFECAPIFEEINLAVDHNQLLMDLMDKVARRHHFKVLFHEKPYAGINGSGKHNNWSMVTNTGKNLLSPGGNPKSNLMFLTFFINTIKAVHEHADLLRASIASAANDHRLGANEAPPAIMSVFLGAQLSSILDNIEKKVGSSKMSVEDKTALKLNIGKIPEILLDNTDRNRTSPFAFTGNKFEFRAVGSSANSSNSMAILNTIVADQLRKFRKEVDALIKKNVKKDEAILRVLRQYIVETKNIRFEGNGYSEEWVKEAKKRGLSNHQTTPVALDAMVSKKSLKLFEDNHIFTHREAEARHEIMLETYIKKIEIESRVIGDLAQNHIIPAAFRYQNFLAETVDNIKDCDLKAETYATQLQLIKEISAHVNAIKKNVDAMLASRDKGNKIADLREKAIFYCDKVKISFSTIREHVDALEMIIDDEIWPMVKYRELVTIR